jgi:hypothetical protein
MSKLPKSISPSHYNLTLVPKPSKREQLGFEEFSAKVNSSLLLVLLFEPHLRSMSPFTCTVRLTSSC